MAHHFYGDGRFDETSGVIIRPTVVLNLNLIEKELRKYPYIIDVAIFTITDYEYRNNRGNARRVLIFIHLDEKGQGERIKKIEKGKGVYSLIKNKRLAKKIFDFQVKSGYITQGMVTSFMHKFGWFKERSFFGFTGCLGDLPMESYVVEVKRGENFKERARKLAQKEDERHKEQYSNKDK